MPSAPHPGNGSPWANILPPPLRTVTGMLKLDEDTTLPTKMAATRPTLVVVDRCLHLICQLPSSKTLGASAWMFQTSSPRPSSCSATGCGRRIAVVVLDVLIKVCAGGFAWKRHIDLPCCVGYLALAFVAEQFDTFDGACARLLRTQLWHRN